MFVPAPNPPIAYANIARKMNMVALWIQLRRPRVSNCMQIINTPICKAHFLPIFYRCLPIVSEATMYRIGFKLIIRPIIAVSTPLSEASSGKNGPTWDKLIFCKVITAVIIAITLFLVFIANSFYFSLIEKIIFAEKNNQNDY